MLVLPVPVSNFMDSDEAGVGRLLSKKTTTSTSTDKTSSIPSYDDYEVFPYLKQSDLEKLGEGSATGRKYGQRYFPPDLPKFHKSDSPQNLTAQLGTDISLDCRVSELKDKVVSIPSFSSGKLMENRERGDVGN